MNPEDYLDSRTEKHMDNMDTDWSLPESVVFCCSLGLLLWFAGWGFWKLLMEVL